ncbi:hypothetical protein HY988_02200 [Candidatus Micrarchaeota archaeon]|nr:hypothetical protein [Candidatus Micrarchaeota archaeon]
MFLDFQPLMILFWFIVSSGIPGAILSFSLFRKDENLLFIEKLFIGFALGTIILPLTPFLLFFILGIKFSYSIALLAVAVTYLIALVFLFHSKLYEDVLELKNFKMPVFSFDFKEFTSSKTNLITLALIVIIVISYLIRISSYTPIFQELDPYYYTYVPQQILTLGGNFFNDQTAWYPEVSVSHREIPALSYLEAVWYSLYTGGGAYNNMLLALVASIYPAIVTAMTLFFIYFLVSLSGRREWGVIAAGLASFTPILIYKFTAGEQQVVPYTLFALTFFYAMYAFAIKRKELKLSVIAGIGFFALAIGSNGFSLGLAAVMIYTVVQSILLFLRDDAQNTEELKHLLILNGIVFALGSVIGQSLVISLFRSGTIGLSLLVPYLLAIFFAAALYVFSIKFPDKKNAPSFLLTLFVVALIVYAATPLGKYVKDFGGSSFSWASYNKPLDRTIAEQSGAGGDLGQEIGFIAATYSDVISTILYPLRSLLNQSPQLVDNLANILTSIISLIFLPISTIVNMGLGVMVSILNGLFGTSAGFDSKASSLLLFWVFLYAVLVVYSLFRFNKKEDNLFVLFVAIIFPPFVTGILKAKLVTYAAFALSLAIGFCIEPAFSLLRDNFKKINEQKIYNSLLWIGMALVFFQLIYHIFPISVLWGSFQPLYQNNPAALSAKFQTFCSSGGDNTVCSAAKDPIGFASKGTNFQYDQSLCALSIYSNPSYLQNSNAAPPWETQAVFFRCQRISSYWINSMEWIRDNTEPTARVTSWWDYGHWINFFGQRNTTLRNEHVSHSMIGQVAEAYLDGTPQDLKSFMQSHDSKYALFDAELLMNGGSLGGKYGALNYLSCAWKNETTVAQSPGASKCEADHLWDTIFVSTSNPCTISKISNKTGFTAYKIYAGDQYIPYYPGDCVNPDSEQKVAFCKNAIRAVPTYCVGQTTLANGQQSFAPYELSQTYPNGDLKLNKALFQFAYQIPQTYHMGDVTSVTLFYTNDAMWLENGEVKSGYTDHKSKFYESNLYRAFFLNDLPGFKLVYSTPDNAVKIYKIIE